MKISVDALKQRADAEKLIIYSLESSLYQASVMRQGEEYFLCDDHGELLKSRSIIAMQEAIHPLFIKDQVLRHYSAYDEMVGCSAKGESNLLEVPLGHSH
ncbi:DUF6482 family protein [Thaumasiovibrio subtropicus]|uniref:DUF6482 family protein n=1 Tax=Thaumasiovibrio subtropicus TaxID=1891207 RepID=UPI000B35035B|nr:DUF6482 family protein [Thaumasiovibrio subtropicus]